MTTETDNKVLERLKQWECGKGFLALKRSEQGQYIELHRRLLELKVEDSYLPTLNEHISDVTARFAQGDYMLRFEDLLLDWTSFQDLFRESSSIIGEYSSASSDASGLSELASRWEGLSSPDEVAIKQTLLEKAAKAWYQHRSLGDLANEYATETLVAYSLARSPSERS